MAKLGIMGIPFPVEYGGAGGNNILYTMAVEELSRVCATTGVIVSAHTSLCCAPIMEHGTPEQKAKYLPKLTSGEWIGAFGLTEPNAGTDASAQQTFAIKEGDHYVLNGSKIFITNAGYAHVYIIMAMTDKSKGTKDVYKRQGVTGKVIGLCHSQKSTERLQKLGFCDYVFSADATQPVPVMEKIEELTNGEMCDITINNVNITDTEMTSILCTKNTGIVYFFSMATSFTKAALGAEGVGSDVTMIVGNGYTKGHAEITLQELRECEALRKIFTELYA